jgi:agmatinase
MNSFSHFLGSEYSQSSFNEAYFHILPVPLEASVSYKGGTAKGPEAIIAASHQLETVVQGYGTVGTLGIHTHTAIDCSYTESPVSVFERIAKKMKQIRKIGAIPLMLGGEHSVTQGAITYIASGEEKEPVGILQFDAHMDLRQSYEDNLHSHACVMYHAVTQHIPLFQVGIRSYSEEELTVRNQYAISHLDAQDYHNLHGKNAIVMLPEDFPHKLYITFDVDAFDASLMGATGTPEPGGFLWWDAIELLDRLTQGRTLIGCDVVELAPVPYLHHCDYTAAKLTYHLMGLIAQRNQSLRDHTFV